MIKILGVSLGLALLVLATTANAYASGSGLKVNLHASANNNGNGEYCVSGGGDTICQSGSVPGEVQIQFGSGVVENGDSIRGCVDFNGQTECDSGTNGEEKKPENLYVSFDGFSGGGSQAQAQTSQSQSQAQSQSFCIVGPCD